jgi:peptidoglycan hydrolase CwlO-like protein
MTEEDPYEQQSWIPKSDKELSKLREEIADNPEDLAALEFLLQTRAQTKQFSGGFASG